jgi:hypothetical protein
MRLKITNIILKSNPTLNNMARFKNNIESSLQTVIRELETQISQFESPRKAKSKAKSTAKSKTCYRTIDKATNVIDAAAGKCIFNANSRKDYLKCLRDTHAKVSKVDSTIPDFCPDKLNRYRSKIYLGGTWDIKATIDCLAQTSKDKQAVIDCINRNKPLS